MTATAQTTEVTRVPTTDLEVAVYKSGLTIGSGEQLIETLPSVSSAEARDAVKKIGEFIQSLANRIEATAETIEAPESVAA